jgi:hypothetical protein
MTASVWHLRIAQKAAFALIGIMGALNSASALPPVINNSGLSPEQCYRKDSDCTQFCGEVAGDMRYECFSICDRMLDHCLDTGDWTDSAQVDPGTGKPPTKTGQLSAFVLRMMMALGDTDGDGFLSKREIEAIKQKIFRGVDGNSGGKAPAAPDKQ